MSGNYPVLVGHTGLHSLTLDGLDIASNLGGFVLVLETEGFVLDNLLLLALELLWWHGVVGAVMSIND